MKKIMFDDHFGLTQAVLEGRKTMTRRIVSIPDTWHGIDVCAIGPDTDKRSLLLYDADEFLIEDRNTGLCGQVMPLYKIGEVVAVAQSYKDVIYTGGLPHPLVAKAGWTNKMFVRADLMPHQIRITNVRVERIQNISDEDCLREGVRVNDSGLRFFTVPKLGFFETPRAAFAALIDKISGKGTWNKNPFVFVYEFELAK